MDKARPLLSVVMPAYNEEANLPSLVERMEKTLASMPVDWEWILIDDHSQDETFSAIAALSKREPRVRGIRFSRNFGPHRAVLCGILAAKGDCIAVMASDLQDPPELLPRLFAEWNKGHQVVWAARAHREGVKASTIILSRVYWFIMRYFVGFMETPPNGADCLLVDRKIAAALRQFPERNTSILALITWMGFSQTTITYDKQARTRGKSGWNLEKKLKLALDSVLAFSYRPVRVILGAGAFMSFFGLAAALVAAAGGIPHRGLLFTAATIVAVGGVEMIAIGIAGEYLWRAFDEARRRPLFIIERETGEPS